jgi:hypothetical protein
MPRSGSRLAWPKGIVVLLLVAIVAVSVPVARWAWRFQRQAHDLAASRIVDMVGKPGALVDVTLAGVLGQDGAALIAFRPAGALVENCDGRRPIPPTTLLLSLPDGDESVLARLRRWHASGARLLLWRQQDGRTVELTHIHTREHVKLPVLLTPAPSGTDEDGGSDAGSGHGLARPA